MKNRILILILVLTFYPFTKLFSQQAKAILYEDQSLTIKPKPVDKEIFDKWIKDNNKKYGEDPNKGPGVPLTVTATFLVDTAGNVVKPYVWRGIGFGFDAETCRLMDTNPNKWIPGYINGKPVITQVYYQINFTTNRNLIMKKNNEEYK
jgi:hypothetical protein